MSDKIWAQANHPLAPAGPDTPKQEWESSGAYHLGPAYYDVEPDSEHDIELEAGS